MYATIGNSGYNVKVQRQPWQVQPRGKATHIVRARLGRGHQVVEPNEPTVPGAPKGTPLIPPLDIPMRPRRNRRSPTIRSGLAETFLRPQNLILPVFIHDGDENIPVESMPGVDRLGWRKGLLEEVKRARAVGVNAVDLFPKTPENLKSPIGEEAFNPNGLVQRTVRLLKDTFPDLEVFTDVALDPYNSDGHDGIVRDDGVILNDETVEVLCRQAISQAEAGADCVSPSDMMDGRVGAIREALDESGYTHVSIMSYTAKYASAFYGPFRDALGSAPKAAGGNSNGILAGAPAPKRRRAAQRIIPPNKRTYQQDPANSREALREAALDETEGADILMVKPGLPYLDIIHLLHDNTPLPIAAYQVSGEYAMLAAAARNGWLDEKEAALESLLCLKRAGASLIFSYYARRAAEWMAGDSLFSSR